MKSLKSFIYLFFKGLGLEYFYVKLLFQLKKRLNKKSIINKELERFYFNLLGSNANLIFDIGANVGERTSAFSSLSKKVIAVEANSNLSEVLKSRFKNSNVVIINKGCSNSDKPLNLMIPQNHLVSTFSNDFIDYKKESNSTLLWSRRQIIACITVDQLIEEYGIPDFCKIDVEGFEKFVIEGLNQKVGILSFELNYPQFLEDAKDIISKLDSLGYNEFNFSYGESLEFVSSPWMSSNDVIRYLDQLGDSSFKSFYGDIYAR